MVASATGTSGARRRLTASMWANSARRAAAKRLAEWCGRAGWRETAAPNTASRGEPATLAANRTSSASASSATAAEAIRKLRARRPDRSRKIALGSLDMRRACSSPSRADAWGPSRSQARSRGRKQGRAAPRRAREPRPART